LHLAKKYVSSFQKENIDIKNNREKQQQLQKKRARQCGSAWFYGFFPKL
jgi:hypothetical protein